MLTVSTGKSCSLITGSLQTLLSQQRMDPGRPLHTGHSLVPPLTPQQLSLRGASADRRGASSSSCSGDCQYTPRPFFQKVLTVQIPQPSPKSSHDDGEQERSTHKYATLALGYLELKATEKQQMWEALCPVHSARSRA